jgi:hypothetical protein
MYSFNSSQWDMQQQLAAASATPLQSKIEEEVDCSRFSPLSGVHGSAQLFNPFANAAPEQASASVSFAEDPVRIEPIMVQEPVHIEQVDPVCMLAAKEKDRQAADGIIDTPSDVTRLYINVMAWGESCMGKTVRAVYCTGQQKQLLLGMLWCGHMPHDVAVSSPLHDGLSRGSPDFDAHALSYLQDITPHQCHLAGWRQACIRRLSTTHRKPCQLVGCDCTLPIKVQHNRRPQ